MSVTEKMQKLLGEEATEPNEIKLDIPLFIRLLEFAREDSNDDIDLHDVATQAVKASAKKKAPLSMDDYETLMPPGYKKNTGGQGKSKD